MGKIYGVGGASEIPAWELRRLHGDVARLWRASISLRRFELRLFNGIPGWNLSLQCHGLQSIAGPTEWQDPRLQLDWVGADLLRIYDPRAGFEAIVDQITLGENQIRHRLGRDALREFGRLKSAGDPEPLLKRWRGGKGVLLNYEPFARSLGLGIGHPPHQLRISCWGVDRLRVPIAWEGADVEIEILPDGRQAVYDRAAKVEIVADSVFVLEEREEGKPWPRRETAEWNEATLSLLAERPNG